MSILSNTSVIIPVGPGDETWRTLLDDLRALPSQTEVLVVSSSGIAKEHQALREGFPAQLHFIDSQLGRAHQLNTGAAHSKGKYLWFLHADSRIPKKSLEALEITLQSRSAPALFHFDLRFLPDGPRLVALNELGAMLRSSLLGLPFGDQGFCLERATFEQVGGFETEVSCGEDHLFVWACKVRRIGTFRINAPLYTSARRYREQGWLKTTLRHFSIVISQIFLVWRSWIFSRTREDHA